MDKHETGYPVLPQFEEPTGETQCLCGSCGHRCTADEADKIDEGWLTPGDTVPAGRCPECGALMYVTGKYTVLLMLPEYTADNYGEDTQAMHVVAHDPTEAVQVAQKLAAGTEDDPDDYHPVFVVEGHVMDLTPEPWR